MDINSYIKYKGRGETSGEDDCKDKKEDIVKLYREQLYDYIKEDNVFGPLDCLTKKQTVLRSFRPITFNCLSFSLQRWKCLDKEGTKIGRLADGQYLEPINQFSNR